MADLVLPRVCAGCQLPGQPVLCPPCTALLTRPHLAQPRRPPAGFPPTVAAGRYAGPLQPAVIAFKEHGRAELAGPFGAALALAVAGVLAGAGDRAPAGPVVLVPVPSSAAARRQRGRDHVREIGQQAVRDLRAAGMPVCWLPMVRRAGRSRDSAGLTAAERRANLAGAFALDARVPAAPPGAVLVLVDDVVTSGATLAASARALASGVPRGSPPVLAAVVAATPHRDEQKTLSQGVLVITLRG
jgi:predicted amidophosphoribosyltransferase